jgi:hypothetical protein
MISGIYQGVKISTKIVFVSYGPGDDIRRPSPPYRRGSIAMAFPKSFAKAFYGSPKLTFTAVHKLVPFLVLPKTENRP